MPKTKLDKKQTTLILTWHQQVADSSNDPNRSFKAARASAICLSTLIVISISVLFVSLFTLFDDGE